MITFIVVLVVFTAQHVDSIFEKATNENLVLFHLRFRAALDAARLFIHTLEYVDVAT